MSRLSAGTLVVAILSILFALTGAFVVRQFLQEREVAEKSEEIVAPKPIHVLVAATNLEAGRKLRESDVTTIVMTPDVFRTSKYARQTFIGDIKQLQGRVIREAISANETFGPDRLYSEGTGPTVAEKLPAGMRAVTVKVTGSGFVDGFASPGTYVDVLFRSLVSGDQTVPETTITALTNLQVLAVDTSNYPYSKPGATGSTISEDAELPQDVKVTFAVLPSQATMLKALEDRGEISLALRPTVTADTIVADVENDPEAPDRHAQTLSLIIEGAKPPQVAVASTTLPKGRVIRTGDLQLVELSTTEFLENSTSTYTDLSSLVGRVLMSEVTPGQTLTADLLYPEGVNPGVADRLPPGFRAVTVTMDSEALVEGFVSPGTHVDVFFRAEASDGYPETTLRVLDGMKVLAIEDRVAAGADPNVVQMTQGLRVTLAVPMSDVGKLQALKGHGTMTLAVRAAEERPIGEIVRELEGTRRELEETQQQIAALEQISKLDESITLSKGQTERLAMLISEVPQIEKKLERLTIEKEAATTGVSQTTLAEVLNLPEPPRPSTLDIYTGGSRQTLIFGNINRSSSAGRTASRAPNNMPDSNGLDNKPDQRTVPVKQASDSKEVDIENVSVVVPERKVSSVSPPSFDVIEVSLSTSTGSIEKNASPTTRSRKPESTHFRLSGDRESEDSLMSVVSNFGRGLVNGLSKATLPGQRVEIVRGGVKE